MVREKIVAVIILLASTASGFAGSNACSYWRRVSVSVMSNIDTIKYFEKSQQKGKFYSIYGPVTVKYIGASAEFISRSKSVFDTLAYNDEISYDDISNRIILYVNLNNKESAYRNIKATADILFDFLRKSNQNYEYDELLEKIKTKYENISAEKRSGYVQDDSYRRGYFRIIDSNLQKLLATVSFVSNGSSINSDAHNFALNTLVELGIPEVPGLRNSVLSEGSIDYLPTLEDIAAFRVLARLSDFSKLSDVISKVNDTCSSGGVL